RCQRGFGAGMAAADNDHVESGGMEHGKTGEGESGEPNDTTLRCKNTAPRSVEIRKSGGFTKAYLVLSAIFGCSGRVVGKGARACVPESIGVSGRGQQTFRFGASSLRPEVRCALQEKSGVGGLLSRPLPQVSNHQSSTLLGAPALSDVPECILVRMLWDQKRPFHDPSVGLSLR
ncbi:MAG: hypothetical protein KA855_06920, partial [Zoogloea sp.]|nr:hypothetical protein [Zoogloea sp.]